MHIKLQKNKNCIKIIKKKFSKLLNLSIRHNLRFNSTDIKWINPNGEEGTLFCR